jgi:hypothetical protein
MEPSLDSQKRQKAFGEFARQLGLKSFPTKSVEPEEFDDKSLLSLIVKVHQHFDVNHGTYN